MPQVTELSVLPVSKVAPSLTDYVVCELQTNSRSGPFSALVPISLLPTGSGGLANNVSAITGGAANQILYDKGGTLGELTLGVGVSIVGGALVNTGELTIGSSPISGGTTNRLIFDNAGVVGELILGTNLSISGGNTLNASGGGTPGGATTQVQFNNAGAFGGDAGFTYAGNGQVTVALGTITANAKALNVTGTFNAAVVFDAPLFMNITNTSSTNTSKLADIQVGGTSQFAIDVNGNTITNATGGALATTATTKFLMIANCAGVPTGVVSPTYTGATPLVVDTTDSRLYGFISGAWVNLTGSGGGTPANPSGSVQFNNSGAFGGSASFTYVDPGQLSLALGTITANAKALNITGTFNNSGVTFDAPLFMNVTNTASNSSSLLADLQVGSSTMWDVNVQGQTQQAGLAWIKSQTGGVAFGNAFDASLSYVGANTLSVDNGNFNTATGTLRMANLFLTTSIVGPNNNGTNGGGSNITETPALSTGGGAPGNWIVQNGFTGTGAAGTATISNASPAVITIAAHSFFVGEPFTLTTTGTLPTGFSTLTTYYIISAGFGAGSFEASTTFGGSAVNTSTAGSGTHTVNPGGVCTISNASPAVITLNNHGLVPGMTVQFSANGGTLPTGISAATNYFVLNDSGLTVNAFHVSTSLNGTAVNTSSAGSGTFTVLYQGGTVQNPAYAVGTWGPSQLTASLTTPGLQVNQLWNTQGIPDATLLVNATRINSDFRARIFDVQQNGVTQFLVNGAGTFVLGAGTGSGYWFGGPSQFGFNGFVGITSGTASSGNVRFVVNGAIHAELTATGVEPFERFTVSNPTNIGWTSAASNFDSAAQDTSFGRNAAGVVMLCNASTFTNACGFQVYNTTDHVSGAPTNYERGVFDWTTTANTLTIGTQAGGTGSGRSLTLSTVGSGTINITSTNRLNFTATNPIIWLNNTNSIMSLNDATASLVVANNFAFGWSSTVNTSGTAPDTGLFRAAAKVIEFSDGGANANGWYQWGGQTRVTADVTFTSTTTLGTVTGLSVNVAAGRTYCFVAELSWTDAAAGGLQLAISGTATATNIIYDGYIIDSAANGIKGNAQATALGGVVASAVTTGTAGHARIAGTITVNAAGTLLVQAAQNTSNATPTTIKRGSYFYVYDNA